MLDISWVNELIIYLWIKVSKYDKLNTLMGKLYKAEEGMKKTLLKVIGALAAIVVMFYVIVLVTAWL